jgi:dTDP-4-amino-4,6-dideoxygalactose transaminase
MSFEVVIEFEKRIAEFFGAPYAVAVDSCTHGIELCLRYTGATYIRCPKHTYLSIPMLASKLEIQLLWDDRQWKDRYHLVNEIWDAAVSWEKDSYEKNSLMCISFQYQKHLSLGRGGMILCDNKETAIHLKRMSYDGRWPNIAWRDQDIDMIGYHYYMTPETAQLGLDKLDDAIKRESRQWKINDWPDLTKMKIFNK